MDCACAFDWDEPDQSESWHHRRVCGLCGLEWGSLHCEHDGTQNPCPGCGWLPSGARTPMQSLGYNSSPGAG